MQKYLYFLLWPFGQLYGGFMRLRNIGYNLGVLQSRSFEMPVIAVGNLTVGGTGKTPHVEYLLRLLNSYRVATLSRGYKRKSSGFILADEHTSAAEIGDEPYQYYSDFKAVKVAVCEDRVKGVEALKRALPQLEVIVLDDAMQHRSIAPSLNILITDFNRPFYTDHVLPAGRLRENRSGAQRADAVIVSKCPATLTPQERDRLAQKIEAYTSPGVPVFFSTYKYGSLVSIGCDAPINNQVILLTGIANARPLKEYLLKNGYTILQHLAFPDHHQYTSKDLDQVWGMLQKPAFAGASIITTRKDAVKLSDSDLQKYTAKLPVFYVPIEVEFLDEQEVFDLFVLQHVQQKVQL
ncbi:tetraacyldisaccharide 4'-kinase [Pontibacter oryzae]|uniref:Tetraacyldisaccharide 4'-kinase n=1 Tax=Pontibacter oryzae TaxID=2304593 RepID=A0A399SIA2_9BACT|nr:tetraacyldisaccharide 4'-kinase [Pontibacter oryzae]RIJ41597.1 tetraacyldisaccharide 4'-kinase [Pontibacter oryzae]